MWDVVWLTLAFAAGYVASVYTWPPIRTAVLGVETEIQSLRDRIAKLVHS